MLNTHFNLRGILGQLGGLMALVMLVCMETNWSTEGSQVLLPLPWCREHLGKAGTLSTNDLVCN